MTETRERKREDFFHPGRHFFRPPQTDAEADGGELTENERRRNEKAHDWSREARH